MNDDLISRKALIAEYDRVHIGPPGVARKLMEDAPAVDAVHVLRCKDCIHCTPVEGGLPLCTRYNTAVFYSDFCSCGERSCNSDV